jgi:hypothetical protein
MLRPYFLLGGSGPEVLYGGRVLVLLCAIAVFFARKRFQDRFTEM